MEVFGSVYYVDNLGGDTFGTAVVSDCQSNGVLSGGREGVTGSAGCGGFSVAEIPKEGDNGATTVPSFEPEI